MSLGYWLICFCRSCLNNSNLGFENPLSSLLKPFTFFSLTLFNSTYWKRRAATSPLASPFMDLGPPLFLSSPFGISTMWMLLCLLMLLSFLNLFLFFILLLLFFFFSAVQIGGFPLWLLYCISVGYLLCWLCKDWNSISL